jgi:hypothetical protein
MRIKPEILSAYHGAICIGERNGRPQFSLAFKSSLKNLGFLGFLSEDVQGLNYITSANPYQESMAWVSLDLWWGTERL